MKRKCGLSMSRRLSRPLEGALLWPTPWEERSLMAKGKGKKARPRAAHPPPSAAVLIQRKAVEAENVEQSQMGRLLAQKEPGQGHKVGPSCYKYPPQTG